MKFFRLFILVIFLLTGANVYGQLPALSGFWLSPQLTAPTAMAGKDVYQVTAHYRRQGSEESSGYRTFVLSGQIPLYSGRNTQLGTLGVNLMRDESGSSYLFSTTGAMLTYMYDVSLTYRHHLVAGVQGGYYRRKIDWSSVTTSNQILNGVRDPALPTGEEFSDDPGHAFTTNVGLAYYLADFDGNPIFHMGAALTNANNGSFTYLINNEDQAVPKAFVGYAHIRLFSNPFYEVVTDLYWRSQNKAKDMVGGFQLRKGTQQRMNVADHHLGVGLYYSQDHTGILALQLVQPKWLIGISYDMVLGDKPLGQMQNAVEVTLGWRAIRRGDNRNPNPGKYRRKLPWRNKKKLPWEGR